MPLRPGAVWEFIETVTHLTIPALYAEGSTLGSRRRRERRPHLTTVDPVREMLDVLACSSCGGERRPVQVVTEGPVAA